MAKKIQYSEWGREVLEKEIEALANLRDSLGASFDAAVASISSCRGRVVVTGLGKSGHVGGKISATMASLGTPSFFMHSTEALHGDAGMLLKGDLLIAISNGGATAEVVAAAKKAKELGLRVIAMTSKPGSELSKLSDVTLDLGVHKEADHLNLAPTSSSTATLALGDALAVAASRAKGFTASDFASRHPGGALGKKSRGMK